MKPLERDTQAEDELVAILLANPKLLHDYVAKFSAMERRLVASPLKLPIRYEHISYEGDYFYDADGNDITAAQIVAAVNGVDRGTE